MATYCATDSCNKTQTVGYIQTGYACNGCSVLMCRRTGWLINYLPRSPELPGGYIDGYIENALPCPSDRSLIMAPRCSDPRKTGRSRHTRLPKPDIMDRGFHHRRRPENPYCCEGKLWQMEARKNRSKPIWGSLCSK